MKIPAKSKILVLAPHTDDGEFGCGGTIAKLISHPDFFLDGLHIDTSAFRLETSLHHGVTALQ